MTHDLNKGDLMVAEPFMKDPAFKRTVTLVCENTKDGALGLVLNRPSIFKINEMVSNFPAYILMVILFRIHFISKTIYIGMVIMKF